MGDFFMAKTAKSPGLTLVQPGATEVRPPRELGPSGQQLWSGILAEFTIEDRAGLELLCLAAEALDRALDLADRIRAEGATIRTKTGVRVHPAVRDELSCRAFTSRTLERLGLTSEAIRPAPGRPPRAY
jgi:hypothetical protein